MQNIPSGAHGHDSTASSERMSAGEGCRVNKWLATWIGCIAFSGALALVPAERGAGAQDAAVAASAEAEVVPGGQSIGIRLHAAGVLVVGYHLVQCGRQAISPGEQAHVRVGDVIVSVNGRHVRKVEQIAPLIAAAGRAGHPLDVVVHRKGRSVHTSLRPLFDEETGTYRIGLYIRDSAQGVGTLTFFEPRTRCFGALGHVIADVDTGEAIAGSGQIVHAAVTSIERGEVGQPGEKRGLFVNEQRVIGTIAANTPFGIFGTMSNPPDHTYSGRCLPVARIDQVHVGRAQILTVVSGQRVEAFAAVIVRAQPQVQPDVKGLVIRIVDPRLIARTGGIVQGMSGSPIVQDGRLVGAVTHVFVSDPTQGYGVYAQWMLRQAQAGASALAKAG